MLWKTYHESRTFTPSHQQKASKSVKYSPVKGKGKSEHSFNLFSSARNSNKSDESFMKQSLFEMEKGKKIKFLEGQLHEMIHDVKMLFIEVKKIVKEFGCFLNSMNQRFKMEFSLNLEEKQESLSTKFQNIYKKLNYQANFPKKNPIKFQNFKEAPKVELKLNGSVEYPIKLLHNGKNSSKHNKSGNFNERFDGMQSTIKTMKQILQKK